jgi:type I restriction enzyme, S subunit
VIATHPIFGTTVPSDWTIVSVDEIKSPEPASCVAGPFGSNISSRYFVTDGIPVIRGSNLTDDLTQFVPSQFVFVSPERARHYGPQHVKAGDLVFTCWGTIGQVGLIPDTGPYNDYIISNKQLKLRPDSSRCDSKFLYYYFASPQAVEYIRNRAVGSAVPGINLGILKGLPVVLPPLATQHKIAAMLSTYDELIENNNRRIKILEEIAQRIYREWFVDFRYPGYEAVPLVESELGPIPEDWSVASVCDLTEAITRGVSPKYVDESEQRVINQRCIRDGTLDLTLARPHQSKVPPTKMAQLYDVLINSTGVGTLGRVAQVLFKPSGLTVDSHVTIVRPSPAKADPDFLGVGLLARESELATMGVGSTGQTELSRAAVGQLKLVIPPPPYQRAFSNTVSAARRLALSLAAATANLSAARDFLLPRLMSGEIDIDGINTADRGLAK